MDSKATLPGYLSLVFGTLLLATGVVFGALGAHALDADMPATTRSAWATAANYQLIHGLALFVLGAMAGRFPADAIRGHAALLIGIGCGVFSGSIYWLALGGPGLLGPVTPLGGIAIMVGWGWVLRWLWVARRLSDPTVSGR